MQIANWDKVPEALRFRVLRQFWRRAGAVEELSGVNLEDLGRLTENRSSGKKILLPDSWQALCSYDKLILFPEECISGLQKDGGWRCLVAMQSLFGELSDTVEGVSEICFPDNRVAQLYIAKDRPAYRYRVQMIYPLRELQKLGDTLVFRYRQAGDRIFPLKGTGHKTLKKYLIECRVPVEDRARLVVVAVGKEIVWIPGIANARWEIGQSGSEDPAQEKGWLLINIK